MLPQSGEPFPRHACDFVLVGTFRRTYRLRPALLSQRYATPPSPVFRTTSAFNPTALFAATTGSRSFMVSAAMLPIAVQAATSPRLRVIFICSAPGAGVTHPSATVSAVMTMQRSSARSLSVIQTATLSRTEWTCSARLRTILAYACCRTSSGWTTDSATSSCAWSASAGRFTDSLPHSRCIRSCSRQMHRRHLNVDALNGVPKNGSTQSCTQTPRYGARPRLRGRDVQGVQDSLERSRRVRSRVHSNR